VCIYSLIGVSVYVSMHAFTLLFVHACTDTGTDTGTCIHTRTHESGEREDTEAHPI